MFRLDVLHGGGLSVLHGCYLSTYYFSLKQCFFSSFQLSGVVYFSPIAGGAAGLWQHTHNSPVADGADEAT